MRFKLLKNPDGATYLKAIKESNMETQQDKLAARVDVLEKALRKIAYWFDADQDVLDRMTGAERSDHIRQHKIALTALNNKGMK
tara:strand:- start:138 stop:389 length:252 start_codon:yes stop_codon:yes gene_type:complete